MRSLNKVYFILIILLLISQPSCSAVVKKTPMQRAENMAYCWTPDGKVAFYRLINYWIKMEPDPFPGGGGVYDDYEKNDEAFIVVRDPETKEEKVLFKIPYKGSAGYANYMDWSPKTNKILLSTGAIYILSPDGSDFKEIVRKEGGLCWHGTWSPDSKQILYAYLPRDPQYMDNEDVTKMVTRGEKPGLYIVNTDDSSDKLLIDGENGTWSPDGKQIVYQEIRKHIIYVINIDGTDKRLLVEGGQNPWWSPDGKWVIYGTIAISPDGKKRRQIPIVKDVKPPYQIIHGTKGMMVNGMRLTISGKEALDLRVLEKEKMK